MKADLAFRGFRFEIRGGVADLQRHDKPPSWVPDAGISGNCAQLHSARPARILERDRQHRMIELMPKQEDLNRPSIDAGNSVLPGKGPPWCGENARKRASCRHPRMSKKREARNASVLGRFCSDKCLESASGRKQSVMSITAAA
jgi:hypothetical protein